MYNRYPYGLFNPVLFEQQIREEKIRQQNAQIGKAVKAIQDLMEALRKIEPQYQEIAFLSCAAEVERQLEIEKQLMNR